MPSLSDQLEFVIDVPPSCGKVWLRLKPGFEHVRVLPMQRVNQTLCRISIPREEVPEGECLYQFVEVTGSGERVLPNAFLAPKSHPAVQQWNRLNKGCRVSVTDVQLHVHPGVKRVLSVLVRTRLSSCVALEVRVGDAVHVLSPTVRALTSVLFNGCVDIQEPASQLGLSLITDSGDRIDVDDCGQHGALASVVPLDKLPSRPFVKGNSGAAVLFAERDFDHIEAQLASMAEMGFCEVHLPPVFRSFSDHGYDWLGFAEFDKNVCSRTRYKKLLDQAHALGMRVIQDVCITHSHRSAESFVAASSDESSHMWRDFYRRNPIDPTRFESWFGIDSMPLLDTSRESVSSYLIERIVGLVDDTGIDGIRFDSGSMIPVSFYDDLRSALGPSRSSFKILYECWSEPGAGHIERETHYTNFLPRIHAFSDFAHRGDPEGLMIDLASCLALPMGVLNLGAGLVSTHDTPLLAEISMRAFNLMLGLLAVLPGQPVLYERELRIASAHDGDVLNRLRRLIQMRASLQFDEHYSFAAAIEGNLVQFEAHSASKSVVVAEDGRGGLRIDG